MFWEVTVMRSSKRKVLLAMLAIGLLASCQDAAGPTAQEFVGARQANELNEAEPAAVRLQVPNETDLWAWEVIDEAGGKVRVNGHELQVLRGSVSEPTLFVIVQRPSEYLVVELLAYRVADWTQVTTFDGPVKLKLSYRDLDIKNPNRLTILYLPDDVVTGRTEVVPSNVNKTSENVTGKLHHFSSYAAGIN
jgi:hypothetical protein